MTREEQLSQLACCIFHDSAGAAFWSDDYNRLVYEEEGTYYLDYKGATIELTSAECEKVLAEVYEMCDVCACCGWIWWVDDMDVYEGVLMCNSCGDDTVNEEEG
jgi:hypothetical protein